MDPSVSFPSNWAPPRELSRPVPREVRRTAVGNFMLILAGIFILGAIPGYVYLHNQKAREVSRAELLRSSGRDVTASVIRLWMRPGKSPTPMVMYRFTAGDAAMDTSISAPRKTWDTLRVGASLPVRYLPMDPSINHPAAWDQETLPAFMLFFLPLMLAASGAILLYPLRLQSRLLATGTPAPAVVTRCRRVKGGWAVSYQFRTREGAVQKGRGQMHRRHEPGETFCVLYDAEKVRRNRPYPVNTHRVV